MDLRRLGIRKIFTRRNIVIFFVLFAFSVSLFVPKARALDFTKIGLGTVHQTFNNWFTVSIAGYVITDPDTGEEVVVEPTADGSIPLHEYGMPNLRVEIQVNKEPVSSKVLPQGIVEWYDDETNDTTQLARFTKEYVLEFTVNVYTDESEDWIGGNLGVSSVSLFKWMHLPSIGGTGWFTGAIYVTRMDKKIKFENYTYGSDFLEKANSRATGNIIFTVHINPSYVIPVEPVTTSNGKYTWKDNYYAVSSVVAEDWSSGLMSDKKIEISTNDIGQNPTIGGNLIYDQDEIPSSLEGGSGVEKSNDANPYLIESRYKYFYPDSAGGLTGVWRRFGAEWHASSSGNEPTLYTGIGTAYKIENPNDPRWTEYNTTFTIFQSQFNLKPRVTFYGGTHVINTATVYTTEEWYRGLFGIPIYLVKEYALLNTPKIEEQHPHVILGHTVDNAWIQQRFQVAVLMSTAYDFEPYFPGTTVGDLQEPTEVAENDLIDPVVEGNVQVKEEIHPLNPLADFISTISPLLFPLMIIGIIVIIAAIAFGIYYFKRCYTCSRKSKLFRTALKMTPYGALASTMIPSSAPPAAIPEREIFLQEVTQPTRPSENLQDIVNRLPSLTKEQIDYLKKLLK